MEEKVWTPWPSCAEKNLPKIHFPVVSSFLEVAAEPPFASSPTMAKDTAFSKNGFRKDIFAGGRKRTCPPNDWNPTRLTCCWPLAMSRAYMRHRCGDGSMEPN